MELMKWNLGRNLFRALNTECYNKYSILEIFYTFAYYIISMAFLYLQISCKCIKILRSMDSI